MPRRLVPVSQSSTWSILPAQSATNGLALKATGSRQALSFRLHLYFYVYRFKLAPGMMQFSLFKTT